MRQAAAAFAAALGLFATLSAGCSDAPRTVATARKAEEVPPPPPIPVMPAPAASEPAARELVAKLLAAHAPGARDKLAAFKSFENVRAGFVASTGWQTIHQTWTVRGRWPDRYYVKAEITGVNTVELAWSGDTAWRRLLTPTPGPALDIDAAELASFKADATGEWLLLLFPLLEAEAVFAVEPPRQVGQAMCPGVRVWHPALSEAILYLDPEKFTLRQVTFNGREEQKVVVKDFIVIEVNDTHGVKLPSHVAQNASGLQLADWTFTKLEPKENVAKLFEKP
jgi:hypothetical protein